MSGIVFVVAVLVAVLVSGPLAEVSAWGALVSGALALVRDA